MKIGKVLLVLVVLVVLFPQQMATVLAPVGDAVQMFWERVKAAGR